jgi:bacillithiol biosynthesis cysteine-adding enzyme BshC
LLKGYFSYDHRSIEGFRERIRDIEDTYDEVKRGKIGSILENINLKLGAGRKTMENIGRLSEKDSVVIIGGQQPGLFTGPAFIIYKVLTVLKLSDYLQDNTGTNVIPCFWNASDDSSLDQVDRLGIPGRQLYEIKLDTSSIKKGARLSNINLDRDLFFNIINELESLMTGREFNYEVRTLLESVLQQQSDEGIQGKENLAGLFSRILLKLFDEWGLVIIDPADCDLKKLGNDFLKWDIKSHKKINSSIRERGTKLKEEGYHAQLEPNEGVLDFFINKNDVRTKIHIKTGEIYKLNGKEYSADEILEEANSNPGSVSWNVILRPLIQDTVFPVAATVCGPGEVSYFAQLRGVYSLKDVRMPIIYPRFSATIVESKTSQSMKKSGIDLDILTLDKQDAEKKLLKNDSTADAEGIIKNLEADIVSSIIDAEDKIVKTGNDPGSSFDRIKRNIGSEIKVLSKKLFSALKKQSQVLVKIIDNTYGDLFPQGYLQERKINIFYYISKYGMKIINTLYDAYMPSEKGHVFIYLEGKDKDEAG